MMSHYWLLIVCSSVAVGCAPSELDWEEEFAEVQESDGDDEYLGPDGSVYVDDRDPVVDHVDAEASEVEEYERELDGMSAVPEEGDEDNPTHSATGLESENPGNSAEFIEGEEPDIAQEPGNSAQHGVNSALSWDDGEPIRRRPPPGSSNSLVGND